MLPTVAEIVTGPGDTAEARPVLLIVAHVVSEEAQVTELVRFSVVPLDNVPVAANCSVIPTGRLVLTGVTAIDWSAAAVTVNPVEPLMLPRVAEIVTGPGDTAEARPVLLIVAHVVSEEAQVTELVKFSVVPSDNVPVAVNCSVSPTGKLVLAGVTAIDLSAAAATVRLVEPLMLPRVAEIVTGPADTAVARPALLIVAHVVSEEAQVTWLVKFSVVPLDNVPVAVNCSVSPTARLVLAGVTAIDWSAAAVTVRPVEPLMLPSVAEIVTGPGDTAEARPVLLIVAHVVSEEAQVTELVKFSVVPLDNVPVAVNCSVSPTARLVLTGVTAIDWSAAAVTVRLVVPLMLPSVAEIVTGPGDTAVARPALLIVAHVVSEEAQVTELVKFSVVPLDNVPVAVNCSVSPTGRLVLAGVTAIDLSAAAVTVRPVEPVMPSSDAEIVTGPGDTAVARRGLVDRRPRGVGGGPGH